MGHVPEICLITDLNTDVASELSFLIPEFRTKLKDLLEACRARGVRIEVLTTLTTPLEQASLWRQGRTPAEIEMKALALDNANAKYLANCIRSGKTQATNIVTQDLPGFSWHQWAEAVTCVWVDTNNKLVWSAEWIDKVNQHNGYIVLAEEAAKVGLVNRSVFDARNIENWHVVQYRKEKSPDEVYTLDQINAEMQKRYGGVR